MILEFWKRPNLCQVFTMILQLWLPGVFVYILKLFHPPFLFFEFFFRRHHFEISIWCNFFLFLSFIYNFILTIGPRSLIIFIRRKISINCQIILSLYIFIVSYTSHFNRYFPIWLDYLGTATFNWLHLIITSASFNLSVRWSELHYWFELWRKRYFRIRFCYIDGFRSK